MRLAQHPAPLAAAAAFAVLALPGLALAKDSAASQHAAVVQAVLNCRAMTDSAARLACYDAAAAKMGDAEAKGDIVVIDRAQAQQAHREAFGLRVPSLAFVTRALAPEEVDQVTGVVKSARADAMGKWTFVLEDGAIWRQIDGDLFRDPKGGDKVVVKRAALGSFKMSVDGQPTIRVHRDN
ncbi:hypothetical protein [Phenylobacterium soli]|uniref:Uncharacterized protein n=1 Tax=Phenylobacterium soli TaxID=2170551 RepID=A0A328AIV9_9CAUL|nr:hypothetical protein [Phenylobacterium soli]RAK54451.1 hypothetical protein DJ017_07895 [Phenylobacterium soli]